MFKKNKASSNIVEPSIRVNDEKHILEDLMDGPFEDCPELTSIGFCRIGKTTNNWISYRITTKGDKVLKIEAEEPNMRAVAEEAAKISFVESFVDKEVF